MAHLGVTFLAILYWFRSYVARFVKICSAIESTVSQLYLYAYCNPWVWNYTLPLQKLSFSFAVHTHAFACLLYVMYLTPRCLYPLPVNLFLWVQLDVVKRHTNWLCIMKILWCDILITYDLETCKYKLSSPYLSLTNSHITINWSCWPCMLPLMCG